VTLDHLDQVRQTPTTEPATSSLSGVFR
jgi:hypothetical protein